MGAESISSVIDSRGQRAKARLALAIAAPVGFFANRADGTKPAEGKMAQNAITFFLLYSIFRVKKIPVIAPIKIIGAALTNSHSNE